MSFLVPNIFLSFIQCDIKDWCKASLEHLSGFAAKSLVKKICCKKKLNIINALEEPNQSICKSQIKNPMPNGQWIHENRMFRCTETCKKDILQDIKKLSLSLATKCVFTFFMNSIMARNAFTFNTCSTSLFISIVVEPFHNFLFHLIFYWLFLFSEGQRQRPQWIEQIIFLAENLLEYFIQPEADLPNLIILFW